MTVTPWLPLLRGSDEPDADLGRLEKPCLRSCRRGRCGFSGLRARLAGRRARVPQLGSRGGHRPGHSLRTFSGLLILVACSGERPTRLLQLDVYSRHLFRGAPVVSADELVPLAGLDEHGYRRLRPGAEALLLLLRRLPRGGRTPSPVARTPILELLATDPAGAAELAALLGFPPRAVRTLQAGGWDRRSSLAFELRAASRLLIHPADLRAWHGSRLPATTRLHACGDARAGTPCRGRSVRVALDDREDAPGRRDAPGYALTARTVIVTGNSGSFVSSCRGRSSS